MPRFHCFEPDIPADAEEVSLGPEESHHLLRVLRARSGDAVTILNGRGLVFHGNLSASEARQAVIEVSEVQQKPSPAPAIHLALGIPKGKTVDLVVRQATELGISGIHLFKSARSEVPARTLQSKDKLEKWKRVAREACKQCENPYLPRIEVGGVLSDWLSQWKEPGVHLVAHPIREGGVEGFSCVEAGQQSLWMLIGPEGGLTSDELGLACEKGFQPVSLGRTVLRVETACVALGILAKSIR